MSFWDDQEDEDPLTLLLQQPNVSLSDVLNDGTMLQELRTNNATLIAYLTQEPSIAQLCEWSMTLKHVESKTFDAVSRTATEVLTCGTGAVSGLTSSPSLKAFLIEFLQAPVECDALCTGHFQRVLLYLARQSNGAYLANFPKLIDNLIAHLDLLAVAELIIALALEFNQPAVEPLVDYIATSQKWLTPPLYALKEIVLSGWDKEPIATAFGKDAVISKLIKKANEAPQKVIAIEIYRLLTQVEKKLPTIKPHAAEVALKGDLKSALGGFGKAVGLDLNASLVSLVNDDLHWGLANEIYDRLKALPKAEYGRIAGEVGLVAQLKTAANQKPLTAYQLGAAGLLYRADAATAKAELPDDVIAKVALFGVSYGGELPIGSGPERNLVGD